MNYYDYVVLEITLYTVKPSGEAITFTPEKWPFKRSGLSSGIEFNIFMFRFTLTSGLFQRRLPLVRVASQKGFYCTSCFQ